MYQKATEIWEDGGSLGGSYTNLLPRPKWNYN